jgi:Transglycosylase SLT domain
MGVAQLGGLPFRIDPDSVAWSFSMKVARRKTVGGNVVQVYGTDLGDMTVSGAFGFGDRSRGDQSGWEDQERFRRRVEAWVDDSISTSGARPLRFLYPPRRWDFQVLVRGYTGPAGPAVSHENAEFNPKWTLTLFVVEDSTRRVVAGIRDLYLSRLMDGVGWKQTTYNGPLSQAEVDKTLAPYGGDLRGYLIEQFNQAAGVPDRTDTTGSTPGATTATGSSVDGWITQAEQALGRAFTASQRDAIKIVALHESTNNPKARNDTAAGQSAGGPKGLLQIVDGTFAANKLPGHEDVFNPVDNICAGTRYVDGRYGNWDRVPGVLSIRAGRAYVPY